MSKSVASESKNGHENREMSRKKGAGNEEKDNEEGSLNLPPAESLTISTTVSTVPATTDQFMHTPEFRRHFVEFVPGDTLMTLRLATKGWKAAADAFIDEGMRSGAIIVHDGKDIRGSVLARKARRKLVRRAIFLLNITKVGNCACMWAINLVVVDIPEGVKSIGHGAFITCSSLTTVSFLTTLKSIDRSASNGCSNLDNVDLLHTNLQELGSYAFHRCSELKSMTIPDSLQTLDDYVFVECSKLVPFSIDASDDDIDTTSEVVAHLRSKQTPS
ncbi:hypothetical protein TL16_g11795 [Triparma laevis f. inornata]|uniref:Uncharacterized protein n=1 Tax=Triparma laevis f. inornata TaxID=1714386 RepID=A0A9W7BMW2_9STRA|nr:hypothetical protein TL16_g11795 [Triparma laevis f. inornata]